MKKYCETCDVEECELRGVINFCEDCKNYDTCDIRTWSYGCEKDFEVECNNGFEPKNDFDDFISEEEEEW